MSNRRAPYSTRYLQREPKTIFVKFSSSGAAGAQTLVNTHPFNHGIVNVVASATGIYKIALGDTAKSRDQYSHFAGVDSITNASGVYLDYVSNAECNHATDPNITLQYGDKDVTAAYIASGKECWLRLHFSDSTD